MLQSKALKVSPQQQVDGSVVPSPPTKGKTTSGDAASNQQTDEILNSILPPRLIFHVV
jgi:hypothetical protein